jgi:hypothetical protein
VNTRSLGKWYVKAIALVAAVIGGLLTFISLFNAHDSALLIGAWLLVVLGVPLTVGAVVALSREYLSLTEEDN